MTDTMTALLRDVRLSPEGASEERIAQAEEEMDCKLPRDVKDFLREKDGGEGTIGPRKRPIELWSIERVRNECEAQEVTRAVPGLVLLLPLDAVAQRLALGFVELREVSAFPVLQAEHVPGFTVLDGGGRRRTG